MKKLTLEYIKEFYLNNGFFEYDYLMKAGQMRTGSNMQKRKN